MLALLLNMHSISGIYLFMNLCNYLLSYLLIPKPYYTYCVSILFYKSNINRTHCFFSPLCDVQCFLHCAPEGQNVSFFFFFYFKNFPITRIFVVYTCSVHITGLTSRAGLGNFDKRPISKTVIVTKKMITQLVVISIPFKKVKEHKEKMSLLNLVHSTFVHHRHLWKYW